MTKFLALVLTAASLLAQNNPPPNAANSESAVRKVIPVKHLTGDRLQRVASLLNTYLSTSGIVTYDSVLKTYVLVGSEKAVAGAEALIAKFDAPDAVQPDRQIQLRVYLVEASPDGAGGPIAPEIVPAVEQMKKTFAFKGYSLLDTVVVMCKDGVEAEGLLPATWTDRPDLRSTYNLRVQSSTVLEDKKTVALKNFIFGMRLVLKQPGGQVNYASTSMKSDLTIQPGQKLVVGKLTAEEPRSAIFLILAADVQ